MMELLKGYSLEPGNVSLTQLETVCKTYKIDLKKKFKDLTKEELNIILYGSDII
jgi:excinuclease UvrABC ATPase subunit